MQAPNPWTPSLLSLCNTSTHTCDKKKNTNSPVCDSKTALEGLDHQQLWWLEKAATSTTSDLEIFQGITLVEDMRAFWVQNPRYKGGTLFSLWKALYKTCLGLPLYTRRSRSETLILNGLKLLFGLNSNSIDMTLDRSSLSLNQSNQANSKFFFLQLAFSWILTYITLSIV